MKIILSSLFSGGVTNPQVLVSGAIFQSTRVLDCVRLFATQWTVACPAPLSRGFPRQEYWSGLPLPPLGDLPIPGIELVSPVASALTGGFFTTEPPEQSIILTVWVKKQICLFFSLPDPELCVSHRYTLILARRRKANLVYICVQITSKPEGNWLRQTLEHDFLKDYCLKMYQSVVKRWEQISTKKYRFPWQSISHFILLKKNFMILCTEAFLESL